jgi:hypothetical protein
MTEENLPKGTPILDMDDPDFANKLEFELWSTQSSSDYRNDRERPYNGQPHTDYGLRGQTEVKGVTFRDVRDCFIKGLLLCCGVDQPELYEKADNGTWREQDVYKIDLTHVDIIAAAQNMSCEIEKMMGIYPNIPPLNS